MIKLVLNGSFRSGTTMMWKMMSDSNPNNYVFCEPLHHKLFLSIYKEQITKKWEHGYPTTNEYVEQGDDFLKQIRKLHPNIGRDVYGFIGDHILKYINVFDSLDKSVVLQPNRMHFMLSDVAKVYQCKVAHIIRHPLDVFDSVMFSSPRFRKIKRVLGLKPYLLRLIRNANQYSINEQYTFISRYFGVQSEIGSAGKFLRAKHYYLERFIIVWTITNWYAVNEIDSVHGMIVRYEDIVSGGEKIEELAVYSGVNFRKSNLKIHNRSAGKYKKQDLLLALRIADDIGVGSEYRYLIERFGYHCQ